ncbi:MAG: helix-turn-helix transcriptional regulator [Ruminiclostridium sp.]|nr:helix-turn-helix transcriptional regulator [Ruminiclostridium sp.]
MIHNEETIPSCEFHHVHDELLKKISAVMPDEDSLFDLAELYKIFGDSTRIKILYALFEAELCVCDIATLIGMSMSAVSHQLRILKQASLVKFRRDGKTVFYSLADDHVRSILGQGMEHISE